MLKQLVHRFIMRVKLDQVNRGLQGLPEGSKEASFIQAGSPQSADEQTLFRVHMLPSNDRSRLNQVS
jgi:hypothetical protein